MLWQTLFLISIAQAIFLITIILYRRSKNSLASVIIAALLAVMILPNLDFLIMASEAYKKLPEFYGISFGMIFLLGPLFYFYTKTITDNSFQWRWIYLIHLIPFFFNKVINLELHLIDNAIKLKMAEYFLSGNLPVLSTSYVVFLIQDLHFFIYLLFSFRLIKSVKLIDGSITFIIPMSSRERWLKELFWCFSLLLLQVFAYYILLLIEGFYNPTMNYIYTLIISGVIYFIAYKFVLNPDLISPGFTQKYKSYKRFGEDAELYIQKLNLLMEENKTFTNPDLKLTSLSEKIGLPSYQLSKLINEKFGKSFTDYINEYRVQEFIKRVQAPEYRTLSIYGIALDVGFNSKSSFNTAFKRITGKTPSDFKDSNYSNNTGSVL